jgi:hypothetical protein
VRGGSNAARRQVTQIPAGFARTRRKQLTFPGPQTICVALGFPESGC